MKLFQRVLSVDGNYRASETCCNWALEGINLAIMDKADQFGFEELKRRVEELEKFRVETDQVLIKLTKRVIEAEIQIKEINGGGPLPRRVPELDFKLEHRQLFSFLSGRVQKGKGASKC